MFLLHYTSTVRHYTIKVYWVEFGLGVGCVRVELGIVAILGSIYSAEKSGSSVSGGFIQLTIFSESDISPFLLFNMYNQ